MGDDLFKKDPSKEKKGDEGEAKDVRIPAYTSSGCECIDHGFLTCERHQGSPFAMCKVKAVE